MSTISKNLTDEGKNYKIEKTPVGRGQAPADQVDS